MFVLYLLEPLEPQMETRDYEIFTGSKRPRVAVWYKNESMWMVPGTVRADD
jgi:hypothetical protein